MEPVASSLWQKFTGAIHFANPFARIEQLQATATQVESSSKSTIATHIRSELLSGRSFEMSHAELICRVLGAATLNDAPPHDEALRLAGRWIQNGGTRIFSERWQCLAELIRNAHDACLPVDQQVGEFGIGFFGVFGVMNEDSSVEMLTWTVDKELPGYKMILGQGKVHFSPLNAEDKKFRPSNGHGTRITLRGVTYTPQEILPYIHFFDFAELVSDSVKVEYGDDNVPITVSDRGTGVTLQTAVESMLVPTSSSKPRHRNQTEPNARPVEFVQWSGKAEREASYFLMTVQGSICMRKKLSEPLSVKIDGRPADILIKMPLGTRQTLSRDEILIDEDEKDFETCCLFHTLVEVLRSGCEGDGDLRLFCTLYKAFKGWEAATSSQHMRSRFTRYARKVFLEVYAADPNLVAVRPENFDRLKEILQGTNSRMIAIDPMLVDHHFGRLQQLVRDYAVGQLKDSSSEVERKACQGLVIKETTVCFVPDDRLPKTSRGVPMICTLNVKNTLFVPRSLLETALKSETPLSRVQEEIICRYAEDGMPVPQPVRNDQNERDLTPMIIVKSDPNALQSIPTHRDYEVIGNPASHLSSFSHDQQVGFIKQLVKKINEFNALWKKYKGIMDSRDFFEGETEECWRRLNQLLMALLRKWNIQGEGCLALGERVLWPLPEQPKIRDLSLLFAVLMLMEKNIPLFRFFRKVYPQLTQYQGELPVLGMNSGDHSDFQRVARRMRELQWARLHGQSFARSFWTPQEKGMINEVITRQIMSLTFAQTGMTPTLKDRVELFIESLSSMYDRYLTIPAKDIEYNYANKQFHIKFQQPEDDKDHWDDAGRVLKQLDSQSALRLIDLSLEFFARQTCCDGSKKHVYIDRDMILPTLLDVNPMGFAAKLLLDLKFHPTTVSLLIDESRDAADFLLLTVLCASYHKNESNSIFKFSGQELERIHPDLRFFIQEFIQRRVDIRGWSDPIDLSTSYEWIEKQIMQSWLYSSFCDYAKTIRQPPSDVHLLDTFQSRSQTIGFDRAMPISLKKLTQCCFTESKELHRWLEEGNLQEALALIYLQKEFIPLRKVSQNVSNSTEQSPLASFFGECIQNSSDAIDSFAQNPEANQRRNDWHPIDLSVGIMGGNSLVLSIRDQIGFPDLKTVLLDLLVPENSHKNADVSVGQMGNGFAKVFMKARLVIVSTGIIGPNGKGYEIQCQPIRIGNVVEDVSIRIYETRKATEGTLIRVLMPPSTVDQVRMDARHALYYLRDTLGSAQFSHIPLRLTTTNGSFETLNQPDPNMRPLVCKSPGHRDLEVRKLHTKGQKSIVTTGKIPFLPLSVFCSQYTLLPHRMLNELHYQYALLLPVGMYEPVQSRSKLQLKPGKEKLVAALLHDAYYMIKLHKEEKDWSKLFLHGESTGAVGQLILKPGENTFENTLKMAKGTLAFDASSWMATHQPTLLRNCIWKSFAAIIESQIVQQTKIAEIIAGDEEHNHSLQALIDTAYAELTAQPSLVLAEKHIKLIIKLSNQRRSEIRRLFEQWQIELLNNPRRHFVGNVIDPIEVEFLVKLIKGAVIMWFARKVEKGSVMYFHADEVRSAHAFFGESALERMKNVAELGLAVAAVPFYLLGLGLEKLGSVAGSAASRLTEAIRSRIPERNICLTCIPAMNAVQAIPVLQDDLSQLHRLATFAIQTYFNCVWSVLEQKGHAPKVQFVNCLKYGARYQPETHVIEINLKEWPLSKLLHLIQAIVKGDMEVVSEKMKDLIIPSRGEAGMLNHELEHARTRNLCDGEGHGNRESVLGEVVNFNAAATALYQLAAQNGAIEQFISEIRQFVNREFEEGTMERFIEQVKVWEGDLAESFRRAFITPLNVVNSNV